MKLLKTIWLFISTLFCAMYLTVRSGFNTEKAIALADKGLDAARARLRVEKKKNMEQVHEALKPTKRFVHTPTEIAEALVRVGRILDDAKIPNEFRELSGFGTEGSGVGKQLRGHLREVDRDT